MSFGEIQLKPSHASEYSRASMRKYPLVKEDAKKRRLAKARKGGKG